MRFRLALTLGFKSFAIALVVSILLPSVVKLSHALNHHTHEVCENDSANSNTHFHTLDLDCEFYKFKLNNSEYTFNEPIDVFENFNLQKVNFLYYNFLRNHQQTQSHLRGPPNFV